MEYFIHDKKSTLHWGLGIRITDTEAVSVSVQEGGLGIRMGLGIGTGLGIRTKGGLSNRIVRTVVRNSRLSRYPYCADKICTLSESRRGSR